MLHPDAHIEIMVATHDGNPIHPAICDDWISTGKGPLALVGDALTYTDCGGCKCTGDAGLTVSFAGTLAAPVPPTCGGVVVWAGPAPDGGCRWNGLAIFEEAGAAPFFVGTNSRELPVSQFGEVAVSLGPDEPCDDALGCTDVVPGRYALVFADDTPVYVGAPDDVVIGFAAPQTYTVTNRMASVTLDCAERVSWEALVAS
jgi:hypothetical protein